MFGLFKLKAPLGRNYNADLTDTLNVKKALQATGYYQAPEYGLTQFPDTPLFQGIKSFQKKFGLRQDGVMKPGGETETTLNHVLNRQNVRLNPSGSNTGQLFNLFDRFTSSNNHGNDPRDGKCRATGTCDNIV